MTEELDRSSISASHWAEHFCKTLKNMSALAGNNIEIDEGWVSGWFANYWAAVNDPLQKKIEEQDDYILKQSACLRESSKLEGEGRKTITELEDELEGKNGSPVTGCVFSEKES